MHSLVRLNALGMDDAAPGVAHVQAALIAHPSEILRREERTPTSVRVVGTLSATAGVICGCLLGMTSLLLMDLEKGERCDGTRLGPLGPHACSPHPAPPTAA